MDEVLLNWFLEGCDNAVEINPEKPSNKPLLIRGIGQKKWIKQCREQNRDFYYMDSGYFGNNLSDANPRGKKIYHRVVKNELQLTGFLSFADSQRWTSISKGDPNLQWRGWKKSGKNILVMLPNPKACRYYGFEHEQWIEQTISTLKANTDRPIVLREKPGRKDRKFDSSVYDAMKDAFATVSLNSIASIESILYGVPAFATVPCCGSPLVLDDFSKIETPYYPDKELIERKCFSLAYSQFSNEELQDGTAWKILQKH